MQDPRTAQARAVELLRATLATHLWLPDTEGRRLVWAIRCALALGVLILVAAVVEKGLWDWLGLLIVPAVLAIGGYLFNSSQNRATEAAAERRAQDEALQAYLDQMSGMLIPKIDQSSLYKATEGDGLRSVARVRTLTVLTRLDGHRKARVVQFLHESGLIAKKRPIVAMRGADLSGAKLRLADLSGADPLVDLIEAVLFGADIEGTEMSMDLSGADLSGADLRGTDLRGTDLNGAKLSGADLSGADLNETDLNGADLSGATLRRADLRLADLRWADLRLADVSGADLSGAAPLIGADLSGTDLSEATGWTDEQFDDAKSLKGAIMPNGQKYEVWIEK